jgi:probable addiction module antidote protein
MRLENVVTSGHKVIVGDANGADKAVQKYFMDANYGSVTVFYSGGAPRNNLGFWPTHQVDAPKSAKGFQFYAAKDREMACKADFGLMIWDSKSPGTVLNVLRIVRAGKICVLFNVPEKATLNIRSTGELEQFLGECTSQLRAALKERATSEEWSGKLTERQASLLASLDSTTEQVDAPPKGGPLEEALAVLNKALASGDAAKVMDALGEIARDRGMSQVARDTGLARESLYRSLDVGGTPEFATIMKLFSSIGLRLEAKADRNVSVRSLAKAQE